MSDKSRHASVAGKRVLVINDTQEILELFTDILSELGLEVTQMSYAPRELELVRQAKPDLVILDMIFGDRELLGWQLLQKIRMDRSLEHVPVIACSAAIQTLNELQGYLTEQGVVAVVKPFTVSQLEEAVYQALRVKGFGGAPSATEVARNVGNPRGRNASAAG
ncbi:MAG: response regulator [Chloroflexi bacterium]|nr:response regulator [Chloroflexota bacterium]